MSVLIDGMEMPEKGKCISITIFDDGSVCRAGGSELLGTAISVSPHGRLIDVDAEIGVNVTIMPGGRCRADLIAPTVIEAEEGE